MAKDVGQKQRPALLDGPSLRNGVKAAQGVADVRDGLHERLPVFVLQTDFHRALAAMAGQPRDAAQQRRPAGDGLAVMGAIVQPRIEVPPVVDQRHQVGHEAAGLELLGGVAVPAPLVFEFVVDILRIGPLAVEPRQGDARDRPRGRAWSPARRCGPTTALGLAGHCSLPGSDPPR